MRGYPLLDLKSAWRLAQHCLTEAQDLIETLYAESDRTWTDMLTMRFLVAKALSALEKMPQGILNGIAKDEADLDEAEANAPGNVNGY